MSQENVEMVNELFARFVAGDRESWRNKFAEDVVWDTSATTMPAAGIYRGHAGVEQFFVEWLGAWEDPVIESLETIDAGDSVVSAFRWTGRGRTSGVQTQREWFGVYDLGEGRVVRWRQYDTRAEALDAAGLSE
jgi:ketosteroid isomerase-like protein